MAATATRTRLNRFTEADGSTSYRHETDTHRFIASRDDNVWKLEVWTVKPFGTIPPIIMLRDSLVTTLYSPYLSEVRDDIADWIDRHN